MIDGIRGTTERRAAQRHGQEDNRQVAVRAVHESNSDYKYGWYTERCSANTILKLNSTQMVLMGALALNQSKHDSNKKIV